MTEPRNELESVLASRAAVVIPGVERSGPLSVGEVLVTRTWFDERQAQRRGAAGSETGAE